VGGDPVYLRARGADNYRRFDERDEAVLRGAFASNGRLAAWDL
jgi:hypothetical protein